MRASVWVLAIGVAALSARGAVETDVRRDPVVQVVERVLPSVVNIGTRTRVQRLTYYYDWWRDTYAPFIKELPPQESAGSGVIIDEDGYILTNAHVVEGADEIWVKVSDESKPAPIRAVTVVVDAQRRDLAVLKLQGKPGERFRAARFATPDDLFLGETVIALGNPFGLGGSVSRGILSSKTRRPDTGADASLDVWDWLQTDAAINPGNSGGPLINLQGEVIGINVAIYKQGQGIGFAIPVKRISETLSDIFTPEGLKSLWFGARIRVGTAPFTVVAVQPGSPAARAGLRLGDQVVQVNGQAPRTFIQCSELLAARGAGDVGLVVQRGGESKQFTVRLTPYADVIRQRLGLTVQELTAELADATGYQSGDGLVITGVERGGPAEQAELQRGQLLVAIGGAKTPEIAAAAAALAPLKAGEATDLTVLVRRRRGAMVMLSPAKVSVRVR